ncbi:MULTISPECIES: GNAT family N-acetyltransferase [unclassified Clostridium]|uniref:GNAT family N-acetyltransferase n=1 Tax=Clostridium sulfidigenes TaxID=318464 RepID=A0A927W6F9_9CLOT|nr:GNAT family N-acetyltransferase [Clostridium sulfidigenes]
MYNICEGQRIYLRNIELNDAKLVAKWKDEIVMRKMSVGLNTNISYENQFQDIKLSIEEGEELYLIIALKDNNEPIGYIRINWLDENKEMAWLRFGLGSHRQEGYAKEGLKLIIDYLFSIGTHRIDAEVLMFNYPSQGTLRSVGFLHEGTRRQAYYDGEEYVDVFVFGIVKE